MLPKMIRYAFIMVVQVYSQLKVGIHIIEQEVAHDYAPYSPSELIHRVLSHRVFDQP